MPDRLVPELISKIETPDDRTIVIHWNDLYNEAYAIQYTHVRAFPRHLVARRVQRRRYESIRQSAVLEQKLHRRRPLSRRRVGRRHAHGARSIQRFSPWGSRRSSA